MMWFFIGAGFGIFLTIGLEKIAQWKIRTEEKRER